MLADYHMHTSFSDDSVYPMRDCIERAILLGIDEICFTEHIDHGCSTSFCCNCDEYLKAFKKYKDVYKDKITLKFGIEFGAQAHYKKYFDDIFEKYPFDFALLSFHQVEDKELWNQDFQSGKTQDEYNRIYFEEMLNTVKVFEDKLGIKNPKFALCGFNPHAGENGILGDEETDILIPAVKKLNEEGINITLPQPADTLFVNAAKNYFKGTKDEFDCYIANYHDQGLIPIKTVAGMNTVNTTIGLDIIRTSPGHGTAFDIAGKNIANPDGMVAAIKQAEKLL